MTSCRPRWMKQKVSQPWCSFKPRVFILVVHFSPAGPSNSAAHVLCEESQILSSRKQSTPLSKQAKERFVPSKYDLHHIQFKCSSSKNLRMSTGPQIYAAKTTIDPSTIKMPTNVSLPLSSGHWSMRTSFHKKCSQMFRYVTLAMNSTGTQYSCKEHLMRISI